MGYCRRQRHSRRLRQRVHPAHIEDVAKDRNESNEKSGSGEHLRPKIVFPLIVWNREKREREKKKARGGIGGDPPGRGRRVVQPVTEEKEVERGLAPADVLVKCEYGDCRDGGGQCLLNRFSGRS